VEQIEDARARTRSAVYARNRQEARRWIARALRAVAFALRLIRDERSQHGGSATRLVVAVRRRSAHRFGHDGAHRFDRQDGATPRRPGAGGDDRESWIVLYLGRTRAEHLERTTRIVQREEGEQRRDAS
jgi:hypothetical protein